MLSPNCDCKLVLLQLENVHHLKMLLDSFVSSIVSFSRNVCQPFGIIFNSRRANTSHSRNHWHEFSQFFNSIRSVQFHVDFVDVLRKIVCSKNIGCDLELHFVRSYFSHRRRRRRRRVRGGKYIYSYISNCAFPSGSLYATCYFCRGRGVVRHMRNLFGW